MKSSLLTFIMTLVMFPLGVFAEEFTEAENRFLAVEMSKCYGAQEALANFTELAGNKETAEYIRSVARATKVAAAYLLSQAGISTENIENAVTSYSLKTKGRVASDFELSFSQGNQPEEATKILKECSDNLMPLQEEIVEVMRAEIYKGSVKITV